MKNNILYRELDTDRFYRFLDDRDQLELIGITKVGISDFVRNAEIGFTFNRTSKNSPKKHTFVNIDLRLISEKNMLALWKLVYFSLTSTLEGFDHHGLDSSDLINSINKTVLSNSSQITLVFFHFDRVFSWVNPEFFDVLKSIHENSKKRFSYVILTHKPIKDLYLRGNSHLSLSHIKRQWIRPSTKKDSVILLNKITPYNLLGQEVLNKILDISGGHLKYIQLSINVLLEDPSKNLSTKQLVEKLLKDENIQLLSEEIYSSLTPQEKKILQESVNNVKHLNIPNYLVESGFLTDGKIFSPLFETYLKTSSASPKEIKEFSHKEYLLWSYLYINKDSIVSRDQLISHVWENSIEESDWALDQLVARVRKKMHISYFHQKIITVKTRGYKLIEG